MQNCAGKEIKGVMSFYSATLLFGCEHFVDLISKTDDLQLIRIYNTSCIFFSIASLEGRLNEFISIQILIDIEKQVDELVNIRNKEKQLSFEDKWNLVNEIFNYRSWDNSKEPFQSFNILRSLRNELVHYKGDVLGKNVPPTKKIKGLLTALNIESKSDFLEDDCSTWIDDLLKSKELALWIKKITINLNCEIGNFWKKNPYA